MKITSYVTKRSSLKIIIYIIYIDEKNKLHSLLPEPNICDVNLRQKRNLNLPLCKKTFFLYSNIVNRLF